MTLEGGMTAQICLTAAEDGLVRALAEVWDRYVDLPVEHPMDRGEFARVIHDAQARVLMRPARRLLDHE